MCFCCAFSIDPVQVQQALDGDKLRPATVPQSSQNLASRSRSPSKLASEPVSLKAPERNKRKKSPKTSPRSDSKSPVPKIEVSQVNFREEVLGLKNDLDPDPVYDNAVPVPPKRRSKKHAGSHRNNGL